MDPGAVSILGVVNDLNYSVEIIIDKNVWDKKALQCHPLVNTRTLVISLDNIKRLLELTGHDPRILNVPARG